MTITVNQALTEGARRLDEAGTQDSRRTARLLLGQVLGRDQASLIAHPEDPIEQSTYLDYLALVCRKEHGEPLQHLTGHQEFFGLDFFVSSDVLIPRPETEFLVERVIELAKAWDSGAGTNRKQFTIADVGTGSGCIAVALAVNLPSARIIATDLSSEALVVARRNVERNGVANKIDFAAGDLLEPLREMGLEGSIDVIASNPPYIPRSKPESVHREVRDFEPVIALFGGDDGLDFYRRLLSEGPDFLTPGGCLVCEIGYSQLESISALIDQKVWKIVDVIRDLQDFPRTLTLRLASPR